MYYQLLLITHSEWGQPYTVHLYSAQSVNIAMLFIHVGMAPFLASLKGDGWCRLAVRLVFGAGALLTHSALCFPQHPILPALWPQHPILPALWPQHPMLPALWPPLASCPEWKVRVCVQLAASQWFIAWSLSEVSNVAVWMVRWCMHRTLSSHFSMHAVAAFHEHFLLIQCSSNVHSTHFGVYASTYTWITKSAHDLWFWITSFIHSRHP